MCPASLLYTKNNIAVKMITVSPESIKCVLVTVERERERERERGPVRSLGHKRNNSESQF